MGNSKSSVKGTNIPALTGNSSTEEQPAPASEGALQLQALQDVCFSYLDHLEFIIDGRKQNQDPEVIFTSLQSNVANAKAQLGRFNDSLARRKSTKIAPPSSNEQKSQNNSSPNTPHDEDKDLDFETMFTARNLNTYG